MTPEEMAALRARYVGQDSYLVTKRLAAADIFRVLDALSASTQEREALEARIGELTEENKRLLRGPTWDEQNMNDALLHSWRNECERLHTELKDATEGAAAKFRQFTTRHVDRELELDALRAERDALKARVGEFEGDMARIVNVSEGALSTHDIAYHRGRIAREALKGPSLSPDVPQPHKPPEG